MNDTFNLTEDWKVLQLSAPFFDFLSIPFFSFISAFISPFYIYVTKKNKLIDQRTVVFPLTMHIYSILVKFIWLEYSLIVFSSTVAYLYQYNIKVVTIFFLLVLLLWFAQDVLIQVQHILLFVQAFQRFLLYFIPKLEKFINFSNTNTNSFVYILCISITIKDVVLFVLLWFSMASDEKRVKIGKMELGLDDVLLYRMSFYGILNALLLLVCILYIPMFISIWKLRHLRSVALFRPQKYLFYQIASIFSAKVVTTCIISAYFAACLLMSKLQNDQDKFLYTQKFSFEVVPYYFLCDCSLIPIVIQLTYLFCNKRNVDTLLSSPLGRAVKFIFCHNRQMHQVEPTVWTTNNPTV